MKTGIPIFFVHFGYHYILDYAVNQVIKYNPNSEIIFLGDSANKRLEKFGITHIDASKYFQNANKMKNLYVHLSPNSPRTELICMQRWLIVSEYVHKNNIDTPFMLLDSDVLIYTDVTEYLNKYFDGYDISLCGEFGPGYVAFRDKNIIKTLCDTIISYYENEEKLDKLKAMYEIQRKICGGICDMTLIDLFVKENNIKILNMVEIRDNACFDTHIGKNDDRFPLKNGIKKIVMKHNIPHCYNVKTNKMVKLLSIHFQGVHKKHMPFYYTGDKRKVKNIIFPILEYLKFGIKHRIYSILVKLKLKKVK